ncbi:hypothetical protein [Micromonospora sp. NPDC023633]|uniref:hypothetical protein n=1 Tax=Micromonospora sp. NPDC023633 TaxID=3154320 RepID=UPI0033CAE3A8
MNGFPSFMFLGGDADGGVTAICDHWSHEAPGPLHNNGFAYHAGNGESGAQGLPYFAALGDFIAHVQQHARSH